MSEFGQKLGQAARTSAVPLLSTFFLLAVVREASLRLHPNLPPQIPVSGEPLPSDFKTLDELRKRVIAFPVQKPSDAILFPVTIDPIPIEGTNVKLSLNALPEGMEFFYSPFGIRQLYRDLNLNRIPSIQLHFYTGYPNDNPADAEWQDGNCKVHAPIQYMNLISDFVLPHFPQQDWDRRKYQMTQEWNARIAAVVRHEAKHGSAHFQLQECRLISTTSREQAEIEAIQEELRSRERPLAFWFQLKQDQSFSTNSLVQTFWRQQK